MCQLGFRGEGSGGGCGCWGQRYAHEGARLGAEHISLGLQRIGLGLEERDQGRDMVRGSISFPEPLDTQICLS